MFWRFGPTSDDPAAAPLLYDEVRHFLRRGEGPFIRVPHHPALILSLLLRMHAQNRTVSPAEICAYLELPKGARIKGHVNELRKKVAECGLDPKRVIDHASNHTGYRLATDIDAGMLVEGDALRIVDTILASSATVAPGLRAQLQELRSVLIFCSAFALGSATWLLRSPSDELPIAHHELEEGTWSRPLVPAPDVETEVRPPNAGRVHEDGEGYLITLEHDPMGASQAQQKEPEACFALARDLPLERSDVLLVQVGGVAAGVKMRLVIGVEGQAPEARTSQVFELEGGDRRTLRVEAKALPPALRGHVRRICIGARDATQGAEGSTTIRLRAIRQE